MENLKKGLAESGQELKESFTKKGKELKKKGLELRDIHDKAIFEQRKKYHLWVNENSSPALAMMMSAASLGILATLPMSSLTPCIAVMGLVLGTTYRANKIANTLDHDEKKMGKNHIYFDKNMLCLLQRNNDKYNIDYKELHHVSQYRLKTHSNEDRMRFV
mgnify:CR=1 FL=1